MPAGRQRKMKGGFWESLTQGATNFWDKTKKATSDAYGATASSTSSYPSATTSYAQPTPSYAQPTPSYTPSYTQATSSGGKKSRKRSRKMRGGYGDNIALTGLAASASSISDIKSAQPLNIVGGKRRTKKCRGHRRAKSCKRCRR